MKTALKIMFSLVMVLGLSSVCFAQHSTSLPAIDVKAQILASSGFSVTISKVLASGFVPDTSIDFGTLTLDPANHIFVTGWYYALDVAVDSNTGTWTISHQANSVAGGGTNLDSNINVTFVKQLTATTAADLVNGKVSYLNSNGKSYSSTDLSGGWLRIYYGLGTGNLAAGKQDNPGVTPIGATKTPANYKGSVVLTLTTSA